jgi:regulator of sigma E protease
VDLVEGGAAAQAPMKSGDKIVGIAGKKIDTFEQMRTIILASPGRPLDVEVLREGKPVRLTVTPEPKGENGGGVIGVSPADSIREPIAAADAMKKSIILPAQVVSRLVVGLGRIVTGKEKASLSGPVGISKEIGKAANRGIDDYLYILGMLSAYLGGFNLLPLPALDGGRLAFLTYEGVARRKPDARVEAHVHAIGLLMFLALMVVVSVFDIRGE